LAATTAAAFSVILKREPRTRRESIVEELEEIEVDSRSALSREL
jgi:hypothetical protein